MPDAVTPDPAELVAAYQSGVSMAQIVKDYPIAYKALHAVLVDAGIEPGSRPFVRNSAHRTPRQKGTLPELPADLVEALVAPHVEVEQPVPALPAVDPDWAFVRWLDGCPHHITTETQDQDFVLRRQDGQSSDDIAAAHDVCPVAVYAGLYRQGVRGRRKTRKIAKPDKATDRRRSTPATIDGDAREDMRGKRRSERRERGLAAQSRLTPEELQARRTAMVKAVIVDGRPLGSVAEEWNLTESRISQIMRDAGVDVAAVRAREQAVRDEAVLAEIRKGRTTAEIMETLGESENMVQRVGRDAGVTIARPEQLSADETTLREVAERYKAGETLAELAVAYGRHHSTIVKWLERQGVPRRPVGLKRRRT